VAASFTTVIDPTASASGGVVVGSPGPDTVDAAAGSDDPGCGVDDAVAVRSVVSPSDRDPHPASHGSERTLRTVRRDGDTGEGWPEVSFVCSTHRAIRRECRRERAATPRPTEAVAEG
jgi:hypothetical protein